MGKDFQQLEWDDSLVKESALLAQLAQAEDLDLPGGKDLTSTALIASKQHGRAAFAAREDIVVAGLPALAIVAQQYSSDLRFEPLLSDGASASKGEILAEVSGPATALLAAERVMLNFLSRLSGIATNTWKYTSAVQGTPARVYDTRKTTPGWRKLEKYAVRCGGGKNHRTGLYDAILIKDNHLAFGSGEAVTRFTPAQAVRRAREFVHESKSLALIEIEVDTLEQLESVLPEHPDIVLLDNMPPNRLREAVSLRKRIAPGVELDASGGITLDNVREIAQTGVERISIGALVHAARWVDIGLDWLD